MSKRPPEGADDVGGAVAPPAGRDPTAYTRHGTLRSTVYEAEMVRLQEQLVMLQYWIVRQGLKVACVEEIALRMGFISQTDLEKIIDGLPKNEYRDYLRTVCDEGPSAGPEPVG